MTDRRVHGDGRIVFRRSGLAVGEIYFQAAAAWDLGSIDVLRIVASPAARSGGRRSNDAHTLAIDLGRDEDELFDDISADTRRKIRRALDTDESSTRLHEAPTPEVVGEFADAYDDFARGRALAPVFRPRLYALASAGSLLLSAVYSGEGRVLVWHAYAATAGHAHLLYSSSRLPDATQADERNLIGRANRLLHWHDIVHAKGRGLDVLDL